MRRNKSRSQGKVDWLLANPLLWERFPRYGNHERDIVKAMQAAGLVSEATHWHLLNVGRLISEARKQRRERLAGRALPVVTSEPNGFRVALPHGDYVASEVEA